MKRHGSSPPPPIWVGPSDADPAAAAAMRDNVHFVLVEPEEPGNVGAAARALKCMGFSKLVLVNPCETDHDDTKRLAHRSFDIVEGARRVATLEEALRPMKLVVGTTTRRRHVDFPWLTPPEAAARLVGLAARDPVAIVFGRESKGLSSAEMFLCQVHSSIPAATNDPSLNLAQAVMVYALTLFNAMSGAIHHYPYDVAEHHEMEALFVHLRSVLMSLDFAAWDGIDNFVARFRRVLGRSMPEKRDVQLFHKLLQTIEGKRPDRKA